MADTGDGVTDQVGTEPGIGVEIESFDQPRRHYQRRGAGAVLNSSEVTAADPDRSREGGQGPR